jgi:Ureidoglycolate lyase
MVLIAREASAESLEGVGLFVTPGRGQPPEAGAEFSFELAAPDLGMPAGLCAGRLDCVSRPMRLARMERHLRTPEMLSAVDGDAIVCVAPSQKPRGGAITGLRAIILRRGQAMVLATGAWHWIPFPTGAASVRFLVVFRAETGDDDLHFCDLADRAAIEIPQGATK